MNDETMTTEEKTAAAHAQAAYDETGLNGTAINWRYWVEQMPTLSAAQAACLMSALEPDKFATLSERHGKDDPSRNIEKARKIQRLAESQGKLMASPTEWVEWAQALRINVHTGFLLAVWELPEQPATSAVKGGAGETAKAKAGRKPGKQRERLGQILDALDAWAATHKENFDRQAMPGQVGTGADDEGGFHWFCASLGGPFKTDFQKSHRTFEEYRAGLCTFPPYAKSSNFYRHALPDIAQSLQAAVNVSALPRKRRKAL